MQISNVSDQLEVFYEFFSLFNSIILKKSSHCGSKTKFPLKRFIQSNQTQKTFDRAFIGLVGKQWKFVEKTSELQQVNDRTLAVNHWPIWKMAPLFYSRLYNQGYLHSSKVTVNGDLRIIYERVVSAAHSFCSGTRSKRQLRVAQQTTWWFMDCVEFFICHTFYHPTADNR